jgi:hypothetical protein
MWTQVVFEPVLTTAQRTLEPLARVSAAEYREFSRKQEEIRPKKGS